MARMVVKEVIAGTKTFGVIFWPLESAPGFLKSCVLEVCLAVPTSTLSCLARPCHHIDLIRDLAKT